jgi:hypothetical protein
MLTLRSVTVRVHMRMCKYIIIRAYVCTHVVTYVFFFLNYGLPNFTSDRCNNFAPFFSVTPTRDPGHRHATYHARIILLRPAVLTIAFEILRDAEKCG